MTSTNKRDSQREKNDARRDAGGEVDRWHATGDFCYPAEIADDGEFVEYELFANVERALAESREGWHYANGVAELAMKHRDIAEARAERLAGLLHEAWGHVPSGTLADQIHVALAQEPLPRADLYAARELQRRNGTGE